MKVIYDLQTDSRTIPLRDVPAKESDEIRDGLIVDYGGDDLIVAIEMLDASEKSVRTVSHCCMKLKDKWHQL
jgi:uncharacterized protein YuzE